MESRIHAANMPAVDGEDMDRVIVQKFGGTSMSQPGSVADIIAVTVGPKVVVVSAFSQVTNKLRDMAAVAAAGKEWGNLFQDLQALHGIIIDQNVLTDEEDLEAALYEGWEQLKKTVQGVHNLEECSPRVNDFIMTFGEKMSSLILAAKLNKGGVQAAAVDAADGLFQCEDNNYGEGSLDIEKTNEEIRRRIGDLLGQGIVPVVTGYRALSAEGRVIALGRGASDYSATVMGAALGARQVQIWTDVNGVMNADPRVVGSLGTATVDEMSYQEARELAVFGAKVLHPRTLDRPEEEGIPVRVLNTTDTANPGTVIHGGVETKALRGVTHQPGFTIIKISDSKMVGTHGALIDVFKLLDQYRISYEDITTSKTGISISFNAKTDVPERFFEELGRCFRQVSKISGMARISVVGSVINHHANVAHQVSGVMVRNGWNWIMHEQGASGNNFTFYSNETDANAIVEAVATELFRRDVSEQPVL